MRIKIKSYLTKVKFEKAENKVIADKDKSTGFDAKKFSGSLKGVFGDPIKYQKKLRNEWQRR